MDHKDYDPSIIRNNTHLDFSNKNLDNVRFVKVHSMPAVPEHLTAKKYVDQTIANSLDEPTLARNGEDNIFNNFQPN